MTKTTLAFVLLMGIELVLVPLQGQILVFDNTSNFTGGITGGFGDVEVGDEVNLLGGPATVTEFTFNYYYNNSDPGATATVRFYDTSSPGGLPGNTLFESVPIGLPASNYGTLTIAGMSVSVPARIVWAVQFDTPSVGEVGLLTFNGVGIGDGPGQSRDDYWRNLGSPTAPAWVLGNNGLINNYGARITAIPEPMTAPLITGVSLLLFAGARRRQKLSSKE